MWRFEAGRSTDYEMTITEETLDQSDVPPQVFRFRMSFECTGVSVDGAGTFKVIFRRIRMSPIVDPDVEFDTDVDEPVENNDALAAFAKKMFAAMVGKSLSVTLSSAGAVEKIEGLEALRKAVDKALGEEVFSPAWKERFLGDAQVRWNLQGAFGLLPAAPVGKREKWEQDFVNDFLFPEKAPQSYWVHPAVLGKVCWKSRMTLKDLPAGGKEAVVSVQATAESMSDKDDDRRGHTMLKEGKSEGEWVWDLEKGALRSSRVTWDLSTTDRPRKGVRLPPPRVRAWPRYRVEMKRLK